MQIIGPIVFGMLLVFLFTRRLNRAGREHGKKMAEFIQAEHESNFTRRKELPDELFFVPDASELPPPPPNGDGRLVWIYKRITDLCGERMIKADESLSNIELKKMYGAANLDVIIGYEENYATFIRYLNEYAEKLIKAESFAEARKTMDICISAGSDVSRSFILAADASAALGDGEALAGLEEKLKKTDIPANIKDRTSVYIMEKAESITQANIKQDKSDLN